MSGALTIRNLTAQPLTVKLVERYAAPNPKDRSISNLTSNFTTLLSSKNNAHAALSGTSQSFEKQDVDLRMEPFTTHKTDINLSAQAPHHILRLTFQGDGGGRWRIDTPSASASATSQPLVPLAPDPKHDYTAIYLAPSALLALHERTDLQSWMRALRDDTPLSALSIPGTHNSPTHHTALPSVRCQAVSPAEQLRNGVRFFDVRVQVAGADAADLNLVHAIFPISLTGAKKFHRLLDDLHAFLRENPSETVVLSVKREGTGSGTDAQLAALLRRQHAQGWWTAPRIPTLGEVRGQVVLLRRFALDAATAREEHGGRGWGLDALNWADNTPNARCGHVCVQDFYEVLEPESVARKIVYCCEHLARAGREMAPIAGVTTDGQCPMPPGPVYVNFLSASNFWKAGCWPGRIAARVNPAVVAFLCERHDCGDGGVDGIGEEMRGDGSVGIVVCDWVGLNGDWDLVRCIVAMNSKLLLRERGLVGNSRS